MMDLDTLKTTWEKEIFIMDNTEGFSSAINSLEKEIGSFDKSIKRRDFRENSMSILSLPVWCFFLYNSTNIMLTIACIILIFMNIFIPFKFWEAKQIETGKIVSIKEFLAAEKSKVTKQIQLSKSIAQWYLAPLFIAGILFFIGSTYSIIGKFESITIAIVPVILIGFIYIVYKRIYSFNQSKIKNHLHPLLDKIEKTLSDLQ